MAHCFQFHLGTGKIKPKLAYIYYFCFYDLFFPGREVRSTVVVFMTDGADTSRNISLLKSSKEKCEKHLQTVGHTTIVHVVGFSKGLFVYLFYLYLNLAKCKLVHDTNFLI